MIRLDSTGTMVPLAVSEVDERTAVFDPSGTWVAYQSNESGRPEIYAGSLPDLSGKLPISTNGGTDPRWVGDEIFFRLGDSLMNVTTRRLDGALRRESARPLFVFPGMETYDVSADVGDSVRVLKDGG